MRFPEEHRLKKKSGIRTISEWQHLNGYFLIWIDAFEWTHCEKYLKNIFWTEHIIIKEEGIMSNFSVTYWIFILLSIFSIYICVITEILSFSYFMSIIKDGNNSVHGNKQSSFWVSKFYLIFRHHFTEGLYCPQPKTTTTKNETIAKYISKQNNKRRASKLQNKCDVSKDKKRMILPFLYRLVSSLNAFIFVISDGLKLWNVREKMVQFPTTVYKGAKI